MEYERYSFMRQRIETVEHIVSAMGGTRRTAVFLGVVDSAVSNWLAAGEIPRGHHLLLYLELTRRGHEVDLGVFRLPTAWPGNGQAANAAA